MALFHPSDPFPLLIGGRRTYSEIQAHSAEVDAWLGLTVAAIEHELVERGCRLRAPRSNRDHQELWFGLAAQSLLTPYSELRTWLAELAPRPGQTVVDLGAAYGRMGFVLARHHPGVNFVGYEYVGERVHAGAQALERFVERCGAGQAGSGNMASFKMEHADLSAPDFTPVMADYYFIYDYGTSKAIEKTLHDLRRIARKRPIAVIGRGRRCREFIENRHPWLGKARPGASEERATLYLSVEASTWSRGVFASPA